MMLDEQLSRVLLVNKPINWTSFDVVKKIRGLIKKKYNIKQIKVGHSGTLDPLASGLLIISTGKKTKQISELENLKKQYVGVLKMGCITESFDAETPEKNKKKYTHISIQDIKQTFVNFRGNQKQIPPVFSAIKIQGERLYKKARRGDKNIKIKSRNVIIYELSVLDFNPPFVKFHVCCSKGTYIRSLVSDIGKKLECGAYLYHLVRTQIGTYKLKNALEIDGIENAM